MHHRMCVATHAALRHLSAAGLKMNGGIIPSAARLEAPVLAARGISSRAMDSWGWCGAVFTSMVPNGRQVEENALRRLMSTTAGSRVQTSAAAQVVGGPGIVIGRALLVASAGVVSRRGLSSEGGEPRGNQALSPMYQAPSPFDIGGDVQERQLVNKNMKPSNTARCVLRNRKISPRKLNEVAHIVRRLPIDQALSQCHVSSKKASTFLLDALKSAKANAIHNHGMREDNLWVSEVYVTKGLYDKRYAYHARGRVGIIHKKRAHLTVVLSDSPDLRGGKGVPHVRVVSRPPGWTKQSDRPLDGSYDEDGIQMER